MKHTRYLWKFLLLGGILAANVSIAQETQEPIASATRGDRIDLFDEQGSICPAGLKRAVYAFLDPHPQAGQTVEGCWRADNKRVFMAFADGDRGAVDRDMFTWHWSDGTRL
ncbi:MAG: hypothetical protein ACRECQ_01930 [Burkholderiaceae bacterium]